MINTNLIALIDRVADAINSREINQDKGIDLDNLAFAVLKEVDSIADIAEDGGLDNNAVIASSLGWLLTTGIDYMEGTISVSSYIKQARADLDDLRKSISLAMGDHSLN